MVEYIRVTRSSDSNFKVGQIVTKESFDRMCRAILEQGGEIPLGVPASSPQEAILVLVEDIAVTDRLEMEAKKLGGGLTGTMTEERTAMFSFPIKGAAHDFIFVAQQQGHQATIQRVLFPGMFSPLDALREDAERIRRAMKKPPLRPPWAK